MLKIVKYAIVINVLLAFLFIYSNFTLWNLVNSYDNILVISHWSPLGISAPHYKYSNGSLAIVQTVYFYWNTPFWIFWVLLIVNLYFIVRLTKDVKKLSLNSEIPKN